MSCRGAITKQATAVAEKIQKSKTLEKVEKEKVAVVAEGVSDSDQEGRASDFQLSDQHPASSSISHVTFPPAILPSAFTTAIMTAASYRPHVDLAAALTAQNPRIDLRLDEYERSTRSFMNLVANYTKKTTSSVVEKTDAYNTEKARLAEKIQTMKTEINQCKETEIELVEGELPSSGSSF